VRITVSVSPAVLRAFFFPRSTPVALPTTPIQATLTFADVTTEHLEIDSLDGILPPGVDWTRDDTTYYLVTDVLVAGRVTIESVDFAWLPEAADDLSIRRLGKGRVEALFAEPSIIGHKCQELVPRAGAAVGGSNGVASVPVPVAPSGAPVLGTLDVSRLSWTSRLAVRPGLVPNADTQKTLGGVYDCLRALFRNAQIPASRTWVYGVGASGFAIVLLPQEIDRNTGTPLASVGGPPRSFLSVFNSEALGNLFLKAVGVSEKIRRSIVFAVAPERLLGRSSGAGLQSIQDVLRQDPGHSELPPSLRDSVLQEGWRIEAFVIEFVTLNNDPAFVVPPTAARFPAETHLARSGLFSLESLK
jgi:hypothetical protein